MKFKESETLKNLTRSFAGECMDGAKYQFLADLATGQKLSQVSTILKALATNEMAHAKIFFDKVKELGGDEVEIVEIKATYPMQNKEFLEMFEINSNEEQRQSETVYPAFAKVAEKEGYSELSNIFMQIAKIESIHSIILSELNQMIKNKSMYTCDNACLWKCMNCGHEDELKKAWKTCPLCGKDQGYVKITTNKN